MELKPTPRTEYISALCTPEVKEMLKQFSKENKVSVSRAVAYILEVFLSEQPTKSGGISTDNGLYPTKTSQRQKKEGAA